MCLNINKGIKSSKKIQDGFLVAYKIIHKNNCNIFTCAHNTEFIIGKNISNRQSINKTMVEDQTHEISFGFHLLLTREEARKFKRSLKLIKTWNLRTNSLIKIIKVFYRPEDVVDYGEFVSYNIDGPALKSVVVTNITIKSLNDIG